MTIFKKLANFTDDLARNTVTASNDLRALADDIDQDLKRGARRVQSQNADLSNFTEKTLTKNTYATTGARVGRWLSEPVNLFIAAASLAAVFLSVSYFSK